MIAAPTKTRRVLVAELGRTYMSTDRAELRGLTRKLSALAHAPGVAGIVLDLAGVEDVGAGLLGALARLHAEARGEGRGVALCGLSEHAMRVLQLTKLDRVWTVRPTRADAVAALGGGQTVAAASL